MTDQSLRTALIALAADIARPLDVDDLASAAGLKQDYLGRRVLDSYRSDMAERGEDGQFAWLVERLASLEARVLALQVALSAAPHSGGAREISSASPDEALAPNLAIGGEDAAAVRPDSAMLPGVDAAHHASDTSGSLPDRVVVSADDRLVCMGFYDPERDSDGRFFRWVGPDTRATLFVPRVKAPFEVRLHVSAIYVPAAIEQTRVSIDGGDWIPVRHEGSVLLCRPHPGAVHDEQRVTLDIDVGASASPADRGLEDTRQLSLAFYAMELEALPHLDQA